MDRGQAEDILGKSARIVAHQMKVVERLKADGADTAEAEHLLAYFATAHVNFEKCLARAITKQGETAAREAQNLASG